jgi:hypothetical protein
MSSYPPHYAYPSAPPMLRLAPNPPRLHWGWVLFLCIISIGLFGIVWLFVQALWVKKATGKAKSFGWALAYLIFFPAAIMLGAGLGVIAGLSHVPVATMTNPLEAVIRIGGFALFLFTAFTLRGELESFPIGIPLSGGMTFFFAPIYFQYHLHNYEVNEDVHAFRGPLRPELPPMPPGGVAGM